MLKKSLFIMTILLFNSNILNAETDTLEKELVKSLNQGIKSTEKFLEKIPTYQLYEYDKTILHYAVELGKYDIVEFLVSKNIELARKGGIYYQTALQDAIFYQYFRIARLLINSGSPLDIKNIDGETALHIAARNGYIDMVNLLISNGASKNIYNSNNDTPYDLVPNFMMDSSKKLRSILKPNKITKENKIGNSQNINGANFTLDNMKFDKATFTLDEMNFETPIENDDSLSPKRSIQINIVDKDTNIQNSNIGSVIKSH
jgi:ankyrin repeat protein